VLVFERLVKPLLKLGEPAPGEIARGEQMIGRVAPVLDSQLQKHRFVAGDSFTAADISLGSALVAAEAACYPLEPYRAIRRWQADLAALPSWNATISMQTKRAA
jgi:glutathione S-transferase